MTKKIKLDLPTSTLQALKADFPLKKKEPSRLIFGYVEVYNTISFETTQIIKVVYI